ncbi:MAG: hypothetical protein HQK83_17020 [Fibrobacteria bacterium]|nr:hypothetical protein [Fibrobacteria bacterium]
MHFKNIMQSFVIVVTVFFIGGLQADFPQNGSVTIWLYNTKSVNAKVEPDDATMNFEELVEAGINVLQTDLWGAKNYTQAEWIQEAHEHGIYVAGFIGNSWSNYDKAHGGGGRMAAVGMDFILHDEPMKGWEGNCASQNGEAFTEPVYNEIQKWGRKATAFNNFPIIVTDVDCNNILFAWSSIDGIYNEVYLDSWQSQYLPPLVTYKNQHSGKYVGAWVWLLVNPESGMHYEAKYYQAVWDNTKNIGLFAWNTRSNTDWSSRVNLLKSITGKASAVPVWQNFSPTGAVTQSAPDCEVQVRNAGVGLDPASVECFYSTEPSVDNSYRWIKYNNVTATGQKGTEDWVTVSAKGVPFNKVSSSDNRIMFKITNTYSAGYFRGPQTFKRIYSVNITERDWMNLSNDGVIKSLPADLSIDIKSASGLVVSSAKAEYSTDGGTTWEESAAECTGTAGSTDLETVTAKGVPFTEDKAGVNKIRFSIQTSGGGTLTSAEFPVKLDLSPAISGLAAVRNGETLDFTVLIEDESGIAVGSREVPIRAKTLLSLPLKDDAKDATGNGFDGIIKKGAFTSTTSWVTGGGSSNALKLNGDGSRLDCGFGYLGRDTGFTVSMWVNSSNAVYNGTILAMGIEPSFGTDARGSMSIWASGDSLVVGGVNMLKGTMPYLISGAGSFSPNQWHHLAVSWDGDTCRLYIDGNLAASDDWSNYSIFMLNPLRVGMSVINGDVYYTGYVSDVKLLGRALSGSEIAANYYSGSYRVSSDGGSTWSDWAKGTFTGANGAKKATLSVTGTALSTKADSLNRIQIVARDINGNSGVREFILLGNDAVPVQGKLIRVTNLNVSPNPFKVHTNISFSLTEMSLVSAAVYGIDGRLVYTFESSIMKPGMHTITWNGASSSGDVLKAGQYFVKLMIGESVAVRKVLMLK